MDMEMEASPLVSRIWSRGEGRQKVVTATLDSEFQADRPNRLCTRALNPNKSSGTSNETSLV